MAYSQIPILTNSAAFRYTITLEGENFIFEFIWLQRHSAWYASILLPDETKLISGVRIAEFWPINGRSLDPRLFNGVLFTVRRDGQTGVDPSYDDFQNDSVRLILVTGDDLSLPAPAESPIVRVTA
jgi:hypothetical protein